jgi:hypothetical protein
MVAAGFLSAALLLAAGGWLTGIAGAWVFMRVKRTYHLTVIWYWLDRLEKEGTHCFTKSTNEESK